MASQLTDAQLARIRRDQRDWQGRPAPCGIAHDDPYNPCLPQREAGGELWCCTCGAARPAARIEIDLNVRVRGGQTFTGFENADSPVAAGEGVIVFESESGLSGDAIVADVDAGRRLIYLNVDWAALRIARAEPQAPAEPRAGTSQ